MSNTPGKIHAAILAAMKQVEAVGKERTNAQQGFKFRGIDDMYNAVHPLFKTNGIFITSDVLTTHREEKATKTGGMLMYTVLDVKFTFWAEDGSNVSCVMKGEAMDSGDKGCNKAMSVALKYALMQMLLIPTEDQKDLDPDSETHEVVSTPKETTPPSTGTEVIPVTPAPSTPTSQPASEAIPEVRTGSATGTVTFGGVTYTHKEFVEIKTSAKAWFNEKDMALMKAAIAAGWLKADEDAAITWAKSRCNKMVSKEWQSKIKDYALEASVNDPEFDDAISQQHEYDDNDDLPF